MTTQQIIFLVILFAAFALLISERMRTDLVAVLIILALYTTGILTAAEALSGFSSEPAITVAAIFVMGAAAHQSGLSEVIGGWVARLAGRSVSRALLVIMPAVALLSAFTHHVTTTAVMLPVTLNLAKERDLPASKLLMPMAIAASLGTTITIIGAPAFLIADGVLQQAGSPGLGIFSIAPIGLTLSLVGTLFMILVGRFLLPAHQAENDSSSRFRLDRYFTELTILGGSPFLRRTIAEAEADSRYHFKVVGWLREGSRMRRPFGDQRVQVGDTLLVRTTPEEIASMRRERGVELQPLAKFGHGGVGSQGRDGELVQAVLAPDSDLADRTLAEIAFKDRYGAIVVGLWRRVGWLHQELSRIKLRPGDVLVLQGNAESLNRVRQDPSFLMLVPFVGETRSHGKTARTAFIMLATIVAAATNILPVEMASLAGAAALVASGCLSARRAYWGVDARIFVFIAGAIPLGLAMQKTGTADVAAHWLQSSLSGFSETSVLLLLFTVVAVATQFMSDSATTAIFAPVAIAVAHRLGHRPEPYAVTVAMAAVAAFLTPIGHHGNLLVYGPGRYKFMDFVRVGAPLTFLVAAVVIVVAPMLWPG